MKNNHQFFRALHAGFTLLELLVVLVIVGLLVGYVGPKYFSHLGKSEVKAAKMQMSSLRKALDVYRLDNGKYPDQQQGLNALIVAPESSVKWQGPYLEKAVPNDPWGRPYQYRIPGENRDFDLISLGADGQPGGADENMDIVE